MKTILPPLVALFVSTSAADSPAQDRLWSALGDNDGDYFGAHVRVVGDLDGDGREDVGAGDQFNYGRLFAGTTGSKLFDVTNPCEQYGPYDSADFDGDGTADLLFDLWCYPASPKVSVISGATRAELYEIDGNGTMAIADWNGDGAADFLDPHPDFGTGTRDVRIHSGRDGALLFKIAPPGRSGAFGYWGVVDAGDWNQDGIPDVAIADDPPPNGLGSILIVSLADGSILFTSPVSYTMYSNYGHALESLGDVDGDGVFDFLVADANDSSSRNLGGAVRVISGATLTEIAKFTGSSDKEQLDIAGVCGDVDGDGASEFTLTRGTYPRHICTTAWIYSGATRRRLYAIQSEDPFDEYFTVTGGDVDGDGLSEIVAGHLEYLNEGRGGHGMLAVDRGRRAFLTVFPGIRRRPNAFGNYATGDYDFQFFAADFQPGSLVSLDLVEVDGAAASRNLGIGTIDGFGEWTTASVFFENDGAVHTFGVQLSGVDRLGNAVTTAIERFGYR
jgi:hypothetical protein